MIYLDNSATTKTRSEVQGTVVSVMDGCWFNPSAAYAEALKSEKLLTRSREAISRALHSADGARVVFTCGGTDGDCLAVTGSANAARSEKRHIVTTAIEHPAILRTCEFLESKGFEITRLPVDITGAVSAKDAADAVRDDTLLVSVMHVNNETGTINDLSAIAKAVKDKNPDTLFHSDGVQAFMRVPTWLAEWNVDMYTLSGHKIHAPKGTGAFYVGRSVKLAGVQTGGGQEFGLRSGTENVPGIAGLGKAVELWSDDENAHIRAMKNSLWQSVSAKVDDIRLNGPDIDLAAPHILNIGFAGVRAETLLHALEERGVLVATGSACSSKKRKISDVLVHMGVPDQFAEGAIRISIGALNTMEEMDIAADAIADSVKTLRRFKRR